MYKKEVSKCLKNVTPHVHSLCCYDYLQEKLCSHCGVTIIFKKTVQSLWCYDYLQEKLFSHCGVMIICNKNCAVIVVL